MSPLPDGGFVRGGVVCTVVLLTERGWDRILWSEESDAFYASDD